MITQENKPLENRAKETCRSMKFANELRIGNEITLYRYFITPHYMPYKISAGFDIDQIIRGEWLAEGTPLTEQWLLDFGFEKHSDSCFSKDHLTISTMLYDRSIWTASNGDCNDLVDIVYVHELQNLWLDLKKTRLTK